MGDVLPLRLLARVLHLLARPLGMCLEIEVSARRNSEELRAAEGKLEGDVCTCTSIVRQLLLCVNVKVDQFLLHSDRQQPIPAVVNPFLVKGGPGVIVGRDEILDLHLLELARAEDEVARSDFIAKSFSNLSDTERNFSPCSLLHILEVDENALSRLRSQVGNRRSVAEGADLSLEHEVEGSRRSERSWLPSCRRWHKRELLGCCLGHFLQLDRLELPLCLSLLHHLLRLLLCLLLHRSRLHHRHASDHLSLFCLDFPEEQLIRPVPHLADLAVHHRVREAVDVSGRLPDGRRGDDRAVKTHHVVPSMNHVPPPRLLDVLLQLHTQRTIVVKPVETIVNLGRLEDKPTAFANRDNIFHVELEVRVGNNLRLRLALGVCRHHTRLPAGSFEHG
mmetsp:Transcript_25446/g.84160  ORF Transcript_25446/g.84160 Transcript_25446/m.84160 type:complete len:392 (+) Transcript_25446:484-1659(+)